MWLQPENTHRRRQLIQPDASEIHDQQTQHWIKHDRLIHFDPRDEILTSIQIKWLVIEKLKDLQKTGTVHQKFDQKHKLWRRWSFATNNKTNYERRSNGDWGLVRDKTQMLSILS